ncbi:PMCA-type calcium-translocating P-type ATPase [Sporodiniella umbellata]|nr:PMCA-type calcium-translocating P-type ATPase [Sporodiniella umbellata]
MAESKQISSVILSENPTLISTTPTKSDEVHIDLRKCREYHQNPTNPFAFTAEQLEALVDPKNMSLLRDYQDVKGVAKGLHVDLKIGLMPYINHQPISLKQVMEENSTSEKDLGENRRQSANCTNTSANIQTLFPQRTNVFGPNMLPKISSKNIFQLMWLAFQDKTLILLAIAAVVSLSVGLYEDIAVPEYDILGNKIPGVKWVEGVAIIVAILLVVLVGSVNDYQKEKQFQSLNAKKEDRVIKATRNSIMTQISIHDIQVGDILHLEPGDIVPVDGLYIEGHDLKCDESAATGESDSIHKNTLDRCEKEANKDANNAHLSDPFLISGSKVIEGIGKYLVTGVGKHSYHGRTMMALRSETESTPLQEKLNDLAETIAKLGSAAGLLMLIVLLIQYFISWRNGIPDQPSAIVLDIMKILIVVVTIVVVAVPEGLPLAVTLALAYATQRMLKDNNLVRVLSACETMGNATTICSDKTGTLTQNKMTVVAGTLGSSFKFSKDSQEAVSICKVFEHVPKEALHLLHQSIAVNTSAFEVENENNETSFVGNKTEIALLQFCCDTQAKRYHILRAQWPMEKTYPFSSERKTMATIIKTLNSKKNTVYRMHVKGASEIVLNLCSLVLSLEKSHAKELEQEDRQRIEKTIQKYASQSLRTISIAYKDFDQWPPKEYEKESVSYDDLVQGCNFTFLGVVGIEDPLRQGVTEAVKACQRAGVFVRMVTGDNLVTAKSIAKKCGIYTPGGEVMEGAVFRKLSSSEMDSVLPRLQVLARSSPEDKRILVSRLRELGDIVAVTGDGTNDGPALKAADVGFSMGIAGTEVAKEASSIILMDDNFSSIVRAIMWGRCVNDSVKKFLEFQLTVNITAVALTFISAVASTSQKSVLTAVQLLWVNLIMDTFAALALATDPPTPELLDRNPEPRSAPLITFRMWKVIIGQAIFQITVTLVLLYSNILHYPTESVVLQTIVFNTFVFCQIFNEINCRRIDNKLNVFKNIFANKFFIGIFFICVIGQCIIVQFGGTAFQVVGLDSVHWCISIIIGFMSLPIGAAIRMIPDELFGCLFLNPVTRQKYLGGNQTTETSVYVAGNERLSWKE